MSEDLSKEETLREIERILSLLRKRSRTESELRSLNHVDPEIKEVQSGIKDYLFIFMIVVGTFIGGYLVSYVAIFIILLVLEILGIFQVESISIIKYISLVLSCLATIGIIYILISDSNAYKRKVESSILKRNKQLNQIEENKEKIRKLQLSIQHATYDIYKNLRIPQAYVNEKDLGQLTTILSYYGQASTLKEAIQVLEEKKRHNEMLQAQSRVSEQLEQNMLYQQEMARQISSQINDQVGSLHKEIDDLNRKIW